MAKTQDLLAMGAEVDDIRPLDQGNTPGPRVNLGEFIFAVWTNGREIIPFDYRERFLTHR